MNGRIFIKFDLNILRKSGEKIQISLNSDKINGNLSCRPIYFFDRISLSSSYNEKCFGKKL